MKNTYFINTLLSFCVLFVFSKTYAQSITKEEDKIILLSPKIGYVIDLNEKIDYLLFSYFDRLTFAYASIYEEQIDSNMFSNHYVIARFTDSTTIKRALNTDEMKNIFWLINRKEYKPTEKRKEPKREPLDSIFRRLKNNSIYVSLNPVPLLASAGITYERLLFQRHKRYFRSAGIKAAAGVWTGWESGGSYEAIAVTCLWGARKNHLEATAGIVSLKDEGSYGKRGSLPLLTVGYRYQKPEKHFLFRAGLGLPEVYYFSFGFAF